MPKKKKPSKSSAKTTFSLEPSRHIKKLFWILIPALVISGSLVGFSVYHFWYRPTHTHIPLSVRPQGSAHETSDKNIKYSVLTGLPLGKNEHVDDPIFCVQTPNGLDGARPQSGLLEAGVIFEAIAETGITRFAAIYQNPTTSALGPIRSLRPYYLEWDTPFDCTIVHAGGSYEALEALRIGDYKDLSEDYNYMYRADDSYIRWWNNLFTNSDNLKKWTSDTGYTTSHATGFTRLTPEQAETSRITSLATNSLDIDTPTNSSVKTLTPSVTSISMDISYASFNPVYQYDLDSNTYLRSFATGDIHEIYDCPDGLGDATPETACDTLTQLAPSVVIALYVEESLMSDNYHEDITTIGSGTAYIFMNGQVYPATWHKPSVASQLTFTDASGAEIPLIPGQTILTAIPTTYGGSVSYN